MYRDIPFSVVFEKDNLYIIFDPSELNTVTKLLFIHTGEKNKYRVFGGLWFGEEKPFFSTFFKPFVDTLQETEIRGKLQNIYTMYIIEIKKLFHTVCILMFCNGIKLHSFLTSSEQFYN